MTTENLPAVRDDHAPAQRTLIPQNPDSWLAVVENVAAFANQICDTDFVPKGLRGKPAAVAAAILSGRELGLPPMTALQGTHVVEGRPGLSAEMMRALVLAAGHEIEFTESTGAKCTIRGRRSGRDTWLEVTWNSDMARAAGLLGKSNWKNYPRALLQARATTELCRMIFADVIHGFRSVEELEDMTEDDQSGGTGTGAVEGSAPVKRSRRRTSQAPADALNAQAGESRPAGGTPEPPLPGEPGYDDAADDASGDAAEPVSPRDAGDDPAAASPEPEDVPEPESEPTPDSDSGTEDGAEQPTSAHVDDSAETPAEDPHPQASTDAAPAESPGDDDAGPRARTGPQHRKLMVQFTELLGEGHDRDERLRIMSRIVGRELSSSNDLNTLEARVVTDTVARVDNIGDLYAMLDAIDETRAGEEP